jgi:hypothetical protein
MPVKCPNCGSINKDTNLNCSHCSAEIIFITKETNGSERTEMHSHGNLPEESLLRNKNASASKIVPNEEVIPANLLPLLKKMKLGSRRSVNPWKWYFFLALVFGSAVGLIELRAFFEIAVTFFAVFLVIGFPFALLIWKRSFTTMGIVTHLREWNPRTKGDTSDKKLKDWRFDLRFTNKNWVPLSDDKGFLQPVVEVEFRKSCLHGSTLEEGNKVIIKGKRRKNKISANDVWNCTSGTEITTVGSKKTYLGKVMDMNQYQVPDLRYPEGLRHLQVLNFRLQRTDDQFNLLRDEEGNLLPYVQVEVRAKSIINSPQNGDKIEVRGQIMQGTLYSKEIINHSSSGSKVKVKEWAGIS